MPVSIDQANSNISAGGTGTDGRLQLHATDGADRIRLDGELGNVWVGGNGTDGDVVLFSSSGDNATPNQASIHLDGAVANITAGGQGEEGGLALRGTDGTNRIHLDGGLANVWVGGNGRDGDVVLVPSSGDNATLDQATIRLDGGLANVWIGGNGQDGDVVLFPSSGDNATLDQATIHLDGGNGDIILSNADCAEDFDVEDPAGSEPGTVMVMCNEARLRVSTEEYDRRVAGVVSGAGDERAGIVLGRRSAGAGRVPIALIGRVLCKVDADESAIEVGDLLTTARMQGHAMKAADAARAFGAVVGKALGRLDSGQGLIPVLVSLQ